MNFTAVSPGLGLLAQVAGLVALAVLLLPCFRWFRRRWDRLTRHRFVRWHRGAWREETSGRLAIYQDSICHCCRRSPTLRRWRGE